MCGIRPGCFYYGQEAPSCVFTVASASGWLRRIPPSATSEWTWPRKCLPNGSPPTRRNQSPTRHLPNTSAGSRSGIRHTRPSRWNSFCLTRRESHRGAWRNRGCGACGWRLGGKWCHSNGRWLWERCARRCIPRFSGNPPTVWWFANTGKCPG